ncbi:hypothetical protein RhiirA4_455947 [Rhizophagus irregularis]|uniref:Uncharacterized protein n=1 Tax=Rhizophagus irregularis TaxID=588596 RepID=A0A2I1G6K1_9GLOM|nr:hypothetical protein RhiirA4_455947 [Rhizophagus irregularis]
MDKLSARSRILKGHRSAVPYWKVTSFVNAEDILLSIQEKVLPGGEFSGTAIQKINEGLEFHFFKEGQLRKKTTTLDYILHIILLNYLNLKSTLESNFDLIRSELRCVRSELGNIYEVSARLEIAKFSGSHYASNFKIFGLNAYRAEKLSKYIYVNMKNKLEESIAYIRSLPQDKNFIKILNTLADRAEKALNAWEAHEKKFLGVMLITSYILDPKIAIENNHVFIFTHLRVLHLTSYLDMKNVSIKIGEIKLMTKNISHGYRQLLIRLASLGFVIEALNSKGDEVANYRCDLVGVLYVPKVPTINIPSSWEHGITLPKGTNHTIRIVVEAPFDVTIFGIQAPYRLFCRTDKITSEFKIKDNLNQLSDKAKDIQTRKVDGKEINGYLCKEIHM